MNDLATPTVQNALVVKLANILGEVGKVPKSGHNSFHNYDYVTENDLVYAVRGKLAAAGIFIFTSVESQEVRMIVDEATNQQTGAVTKKTSALTTVSLLHTFVDAETGQRFSVKSQGQGSDVGDKGGYKAITGAMKYFIYKNFLIPTGDDPEADERTDQRHAGGSPEERGRARAEADVRQEEQQRQSARPAPAASRQAAPAARTAAPAAAKPAPTVPRETSNVEEREQFRGGLWQDVVIHFGTNYKGMKLGELSRSQLIAWVKWTPKPYQGKIAEDDRILRIALDVAAEESGN